MEGEGNFVEPTIIEISSDAAVVKEELFAPVLYVLKFKVTKVSKESSNFHLKWGLKIQVIFLFTSHSKKL